MVVGVLFFTGNGCRAENTDLRDSCLSKRTTLLSRTCAYSKNRRSGAGLLFHYKMRIANPPRIKSGLQIPTSRVKGAQPPAEVLNRLADVLGTFVDFLINGNTSEKAQNSLKDAELLNQFRAVEQMEEEDQNTIKRLIDAFITKKKLKQLML